MLFRSGPFFETSENLAVYNTLKLPGGLLEFGKTREYITMVDNPSGTVAYNFNNSNIWYGTNPPQGNWTANVINVPTDNMFQMQLVIISGQFTATGLPTSLQLNGSGQSIRWLGGSSPTASTVGSNKYDVITFTVTRISGNWIVQGQLSSYS